MNASVPSILEWKRLHVLRRLDLAWYRMGVQQEGICLRDALEQDEREAGVQLTENVVICVVLFLDELAQTSLLRGGKIL